MNSVEIMVVGVLFIAMLPMLHMYWLTRDWRPVAAIIGGLGLAAWLLFYH